MRRALSRNCSKLFPGVNQTSRNATPFCFWRKPVLTPKIQIPFGLPRTQPSEFPPEPEFRRASIEPQFFCVPQSAGWRSSSRRPGRIVLLVYLAALPRRHVRFGFFYEHHLRSRSPAQRVRLQDQNQMLEQACSRALPPQSPKFPSLCRCPKIIGAFHFCDSAQFRANKILSSDAVPCQNSIQGRGRPKPDLFVHEVCSNWVLRSARRQFQSA